MTQTLNHAIRTMMSENVKLCEDFTIEELINLQRLLHAARDPALELIYQRNGDKGRSIRVFGRHAEDLPTLDELWKEELMVLKEHPQLIDASRDMKCHEAVMWFFHHLPSKAQAELRAIVTLPLLPERDRHLPKGAPADVETRFPSLGCDTAHAQQSQAKNNEYVEWPEELTYTATGHGAFPFWDNGGPGCSTCDPSISGSAQLKVMYSSKLNSEILMHASCGDMSWTGASGAPNKSPCNHIFTPDKGAFIYTPKTSLEPSADGSFCCRSVAKGSSQFPGAVPRDWMKSGTYAGTYDKFQGDHYSGTIKMFTWSAAGLQFWYYATPDGKPVQQGESCQNPKGGKPVACSQMMPITLYHDFQSVTNATFSSSDFVVPDVCTSTSVNCEIPGGSAEVLV